MARYLKVAELDVGGMGHVELVLLRHGAFERLYARKRLRPALRDDATFRAMFVDEGRLAATVRHPNVVAVLDAGEDAEGPFLLMEYVEGVSARALLVDAAGSGRPVPVQIALRVAMEAARGLHAAHEARRPDGAPMALVHRDVTPQNILIGFDGSVRVTDFGIAKATGNAAHTTAGVLKGNAGYLSPDQLRFEPLDRRSDLFSLGVVLFELLAGRRLYGGEDGAAQSDSSLGRILNEAPPDIGHHRRDVPPEVTELLFQMLAKQREVRPATALEVAGRIEEVLAALVADEGTDDIGELLEARFGAQRLERRASIQRALAALDAGARPARRRRQTLAVASALLALALGSAALWKGTRQTAIPRAGPRALWAGGWHTCAQLGPGLSCWGKNNEGQLGVGNAEDSAHPRTVKTLAGPVRDMALGWYHTCACTPGGHVACWGRNAEGQLGTGAVHGTQVPLPVPGMPACLGIAAGNHHTCVLGAGGRVTCWGRNDQGQAGRAELATVVRPGLVEGAEGIVQIAASGDTTCAVRADGRVLCWGRGEEGQLGDGSRTPARAAPRPVAGLTDVVEVALGQRTACGRTRRGEVHCWGAIGDHKLGLRPVSHQVAPTGIPDLADAVRIALGASHACVLRRGGTVGCFWSSYFGQIGNGTEKSFAAVPTAPVGLDGPSDLALGEVHTCARTRDGVSCWGFNERGQLGDGTRQSRPRPARVMEAD